MEVVVIGYGKNQMSYLNLLVFYSRMFSKLYFGDNFDL